MRIEVRGGITMIVMLMGLCCARSVASAQAADRKADRYFKEVQAAFESGNDALTGAKLEASVKQIALDAMVEEELTARLRPCLLPGQGGFVLEGSC